MINKALSTGFLIWLENVNEIKIQRAEEAQQAVDAARKALEEELNSRNHQASARALLQLPAGVHCFLQCIGEHRLTLFWQIRSQASKQMLREPR